MVVEHSFVTTRESSEFMPELLRALNSVEFMEPTRGFQVGEANWSELELRRGKPKAVKARNVAQLPQSVVVQFDRGRVTVAASIEANRAFGGGRWGQAENHKRMTLHQDLLLALIEGIELFVNRGKDAEAAFVRLRGFEAQATLEGRRRQTRNIIIVVVALLFFAGLVALAVYASSRH